MALVSTDPRRSALGPYPIYERVSTGSLKWEIEHCTVAIKQLQSLGENSRVYGIPDAGIDIINERLEYWEDRKFQLQGWYQHYEQNYTDTRRKLT